ncbi:MAG TPA: hypothetical protein VHE55_07775 [Fimbriimonadaceae bacterium]|nr:hypothetical protein [Fimbriimonadaceae bacterium]
MILEEHSEAQWTGDDGFCDSGLTSQITYGDEDGEDCFGTRYTMINVEGRTDFDAATCSPYADATIEDGSTVLLGGCHVAYTAIPYSVSMTLAGVLDPAKDKRLLIGEPLKVVISLGGFSPTGVTYDWTVSGGTPFKSYTITRPTDHPENGTGQVAPWVNGLGSDTITPIFSFPDKVAVSCKVTLPSADALTVSDNGIRAEAPIYRHTLKPIGYFQLLPNATAPTDFRLFGAVYPGRQPWGVFYNFWITTPQEYRTAWGDTGTFSCAQLITDRSKVNGAYVQPLRDKCLDGSYPYPGMSWYPAVSQPSNSTFVVFGDRPGFGGIDDPAVTDLLYDADLELYIMYIPPWNGVGATDVAIRRAPWSANGTAHRGTAWTCTPGSSSWGAKEDAFPKQPEWLHVINPH